MCTLIALHSCVDRVGLIVAANRDEYFDRPSEGPALRTIESGPIVAVPWQTGSVRYTDALRVGDSIHYYYEVVRPDGSHELRVSVVKSS